MVLTVSSGSGVGYIRKDRYFSTAKLKKKNKTNVLEFCGSPSLFLCAVGKQCLSTCVCSRGGEEEEQGRQRDEDFGSSYAW